MKKLLFLAFPILGIIAGCGSAGGSSVSSGYVSTSQCYTHDYTNTNTGGGCMGYTWH
jgi:hypothetical protein